LEPLCTILTVMVTLTNRENSLDTLA